MFTGSIFAWALFKYRILETTPVPFDSLLETTSNGILVIDSMRCVVEVNQVARRYLDVSGAAVGRPLAALSEPAERVDAIFDNERTPELRIRDRIYSVSATALADARGVEYGRMLIIQDVTERVRYDRLLERHNAQLETLNEMLRHDVRNDTMVALGWAEVLDDLLSETSVEDEAAAPLDRLEQSVRHISDLTDIATELSQPLENPAEDGTQSISLAAVLEGEVEKAAAFPQAEFTLEEVPAVEVAADLALASALSNVLRNAVVHNDKETPPRRRLD